MAATESTPILFSHSRAVIPDFTSSVSIVSDTAITDANGQLDSGIPDVSGTHRGTGHSVGGVGNGRDTFGEEDKPDGSESAKMGVGPLCMIFIATLALCCMHFLLRASRIQRKRAEDEGEGCVEMDYANLVGWSLKTAHPSLRGWPALWGRRFATTLLMTCQVGCCSVYFVFVSANIKQTVNALTSWKVTMWQSQLGVGVLLMGYSQFRGIKKMAVCSFLANCLMLLGLIIVFINLFAERLPDVSTRKAFGGWGQVPSFMCTVIFTFEGICLVLPVELQVEDRRVFAAPWGVLTLSLTVVIVLMVSMGFYGFLVYGDRVQPSITLNLPTDPWYYFAVKPILSLVMFLSYSLQFYVPVNMVKTWAVAKYGWAGREFQSTRRGAEAGIRLSFFFLTLAMGMAVPNLDLLISFMGALSASFLTLIIPASVYLLSLLSQPQPQRPSILLVIFLVFIIIVGVLGFVLGTYSSVSDMINKW